MAKDDAQEAIVGNSINSGVILAKEITEVELVERPEPRAQQNRFKPKKSPAVAADPVTPSPVDMIYSQFVRVFGNSNPQQIFSLVWPGTTLDPDTFAGTESGGLVAADVEIAQSLLFDQYYPVATITQPDGTRVSDRYQQAIDRYGPVTNDALLKLQQIIRTRLAKTTEVSINGKTVRMTLMDQFNYLHSQWTALRQAWGQLQFNTMKQMQATGGDNWWVEYIVWYETVASGYVDSINAAYDQLIAEFPLNAYEDALAILDTHEGAALNRAKNDMQNAITPVPPQLGNDFVRSQAIPANWGDVLTPSTTFIDLLAAPDAQQRYLDQAINQLQQQIYAWNSVLAQIPAGSKEDIAAALAAFNSASNEYSDSIANLLKDYGQNAVTAVKAYLQYQEAKDEQVDGASELLDGLNAQNPGGSKEGVTITSEQFDQISQLIIDGQNKLIDDQNSMVKSGMDLAQKATLYLNSRAGEGLRAMITPILTQLNDQLTLVQRQIANFNSAALRTVQLMGTDPKNPDGKPSPDAALPNPMESFANQRWEQITIQVDTSSMQTGSTASTAFSQFDWSVDLFFGSAGGKSTSASSQFASDYMSQNSKIQIGMLATKVLIQRPWMHPELFTMSNNFYRVSDSPVTTPAPPAPQAAWTRDQFVPVALGGGTTPEAAALAMSQINKGPFPAYPVALLIVKDVTIKISCDATKTNALQSHSEQNSTQGGGFLCFSVSSTQSSSQDSKSVSNYAMAGDYVFRIAAPQVAGAWLQIAPQDLSAELTPEQAQTIADALGFATKLQNAAAAGPTVKETPVMPPSFGG